MRADQAGTGISSSVELEAIYRTAPFGLCVLDARLRYVRINDRLAEVNGLPAADHIGRTVREIVPHLADEVEPLLRRVLETSEPLRDVEVVGETAAEPGVERTWIESWFPLRDDEGRTVGINIVDDEVTDRVRAERSLRESEAKLHRLFAQAPAFIAMHEGPDHVFVYSNALHDRIVGGRPLNGRPLREAMPELAGQGIVSRYDRVYATGRPSTRAEFRAVFDRDGDGRDEERFFSQVLQPWYGADGRVAGVMSFAFEITDQVRGRQEFAEREKLLHAIIDQMPSGLSVAEAPSDRLLLHNGEAVRLLRHPLRPSEDDTGYAPYGATDREGRPLPPEAYPITRALGGETIHQEEMPYRRGDGTKTVLSVSAAPVRDEDGSIVMAVSTFDDISAIKHVEAALRTLNETLEQRVEQRTTQVRELASALTLAEQAERRRVAHVLHDGLQQQLYAVQFPLQMLREALRARGSADAHTLATRAYDFVDDAIRTARYLTIDLSPPVLRGEGLREALLWLAAQMQERFDLQVDLEGGRELTVPQEDMRVLLFGIVRELLFNVVKHAGTDRVRVSLAEAGSFLAIEVSDEGVGFDAGTIDALTASGLHHARERLALFDGTMQIEARPGGGTHITIHVPLERITERS